MHNLFEQSAAVFVALKLIETGAGRSQENDIARDRRFAGPPDSVFQSFRMIDFGSALNLRFDLGGCGPDGVHAVSYTHLGVNFRMRNSCKRLEAALAPIPIAAFSNVNPAPLRSCAG